MWSLFKVILADEKARHDEALNLLDQTAGIMPLRESDLVYRALLLMKAQRTRDAHVAFTALRDKFKGTDDPNLQYLRYYCTYMLSDLTPSSSQWFYEATGKALRLPTLPQTAVSDGNS